MRKPSPLASITVLLGILGLLLFFLTRIDIKTAPVSTDLKSTFTVFSYIEQTPSLSIRAENYAIRAVTCAKQHFYFPKRKRKWYETSVVNIPLHVKKGKIVCHVEVESRGHPFKLQVASTYHTLTGLMLLLSIGSFIAYWGYRILLYLLDHMRSKKKFKPITLENSDVDLRQKQLLLAIVGGGFLLRIFYLNHFGIVHFQHDWHGHIEYIKYLASHITLPDPSKGLEYPQQPLYYLLSAVLYKFLLFSGFDQSDALFGIGILSLIGSGLFLYFTYRLLMVLEAPFFVRLVTLVFVSFTPSIVYISARINNDALIMPLSAMALYFMVRTYRFIKMTDFLYALVLVSALFATKISTFPFEIALFSILVLSYLQIDMAYKKRVKEFLLIFIWTGTLLLGATLLRLYTPLEETSFHLVNSSAHFPGQQIKDLGSNYFASWHFLSLFREGQSYVFGTDSVRFSLPTYLYGTMIFGEFDYSRYKEMFSLFDYVMQSLIILSLLYPLGLLTFVLHLHKSNTLEKLFLGVVVLNLFLVVKFISDYPVVCNSDFRYFVTTFLLIGLLSGYGLKYLSSYSRYLKRFFYLWLGVLALLQVIFISTMLLC